MKVKIGMRHQVVPDGEYKVKVIDIKEGSFAGKRKTLEFFFEILEGPHVGIVLRGFTNFNYNSFSTFTKLYQWYVAITDEDSLENGEEMDLDEFKEKLLLVEVKLNNSRKTKNPFSNVVDIKAALMEL